MQVPLGDIDHVHAERLGDHLIGDGHGVPLEGAELGTEIHLAAVGGDRVHGLVDVLALGGVPGTVVQVADGAEHQAAAAAVVGNGIEFDAGNQAVILEADLGMDPVLVDEEVVHVFPGVNALHRAPRPLGQQGSNQLALAISPVAILAALIQAAFNHFVVGNLVLARDLFPALGNALNPQVLAFACPLIVIPIG